MLEKSSAPSDLAAAEEILRRKGDELCRASDKFRKFRDMLEANDRLLQEKETEMKRLKEQVAGLRSQKADLGKKTQ